MRLLCFCLSVYSILSPPFYLHFCLPACLSVCKYICKFSVNFKKNMKCEYVICLPTEHQGVRKNSSRNLRAFQDRIGIWKCWFLRRGQNRSTRSKTSRSRVENQQQTQSTCDLGLHVTSSFSKIQNQRATRVIIFMRHERG